MTREEAKAILEEVKAMDDSIFQYVKPYMEALEIAIKALGQEPKTGHWIKIQKTQKGCHDCTVITYEYHCSECDRINVSPYKKFCPNCGCAMKGKIE